MKVRAFVLASALVAFPFGAYAGTVINDKNDPTFSMDDKNRDKVVNHTGITVSIQMGPDEPVYSAAPGTKTVVKRNGDVVTKELKNPNKSVVVVRYGSASDNSSQAESAKSHRD